MVNSSAQVKTGAWDPEEDDLLYYWQSKVGNKWSEVAKHIPGRTGQQCAQRWRHKVNPNIRRDKWTAEEDAKLIELVKTFGVGRWAEIARNCDGRTDQQCMGRWRRHLDPNIRRDSWSPEEDAKLRQLHAQYGTSWSRISKCLKGRTSQQCRARWHQINNGKGGSSKSAAAPAVAGGAASTTAGKRGGPGGKRRTARRRHEYTDSEDEESPDDDDDDFCDEDYNDDEQQHYEPYKQQQYHGPEGYTAHADGYAAHAGQHDLAAAAAAAAAAMAAGAEAYSVEMPAPCTAAAMHMQQQDWSAAWAAAAAATAEQLGHGGDAGYEEEQEADTSDDGEHSDDAGYPTAAAADHCSSRQRYSTTAPLSKTSKVVGSSRFGPWSSHQQEQGGWMLSSQQLLLSPDKPRRPEQLQRRKKGSTGGELDDEETAGAETLLEMAHLLRRESCEFEPPSLRRSDFITASTPPKRTTQERPELRNSDELSPSPFKRARSSRGALFGAAAPEQGSSMAPVRTGRRTAVPYRDDDASSDHEDVQDTNSEQEQGERDQQHGDTAADSYMDPGVEDEHGQDADLADDALLGFGLPSSSYNQPLPDPARPSNASCLTAAGNTAAAFLSPPPVHRAPASSSRWNGSMVTPRRSTAQHNLMNLLGSPSFDRMPGYASPPSAGKTQPSAATLAALQSPQPSCVHEPFWTPFTGLVKDGVFTRGTSATPDLPSGGKARSSAGGLFSPVRRSGSAGSKTIARRSLVASPNPADRSEVTRSSSQHTGHSGEQQTAAVGASDDHGPSPACGLQQPVQQVSHRVVRRLDQHEAWGASSNPSPSKPITAQRVKEGSLAIGFSLFSPVKKQPVPLFNESVNNIGVGASPAKHSAHEVNLTIAPLQPNLPSNIEPSSPAREPAVCSSPSAFSAHALPHGRSPLGPKASGRPPLSASRRPSAARSLLSPVHSRLLNRRLEQQQAQQQQQQEDGAATAEAMPGPSADAQQQEEPEGGSPMAISPPDVQAAHQEQQHGIEGQSSLNRQQSGSLDRQGSDSGTPVASNQGPDTTSCSGTPNTPAGQPPLGGLLGPAASPSDYVTPQQRLRPSRPLAPLHKDCLIAAATRNLAAAAGDAEPIRGSESMPAAATNSATAAAPAAASGKVGVTPAKAATPDDSGASGSAPGSADSSKLLSPERLMDSPLQAASQQLQSPSQWHQGMVMLMRNMQQTPLQMKSHGDEGSRPACDGKLAEDCTAVRGGSRALRRLQAELERGSSAAAATVAAQQQQIGSDRGAAPVSVQVPFSTAEGAACTIAAASVGGPMLPLFTPAAPACTAELAGSDLLGAAMATPLCAGRSAVSSVSLTPAVISCSKAEMLAMQTPGAAPVAWPVQQRPDGGLVVSTAAPATDVAAATVLQLTPPTVVAVARPANTSDKENSSVQPCVVAGTAGRVADTASTAEAASTAITSALPSMSAGRMTVVSIQPVTMVMGSSQPTGLAAVQPVFQALQQPAKSIAMASAVSMPERFVNSHAVRSRLHALIDSV